ncbi:MAG: beta-ketoacyl-[acyl-carrier-protein] synthase family protein [Thermomicrobiales bacterium]
MTGNRRVVVTGLGAITPIGHGADGLWSGVRRGESAVRRVTRFDASMFQSQVAAEIDDFDPGEFIEPRRLRRLDRFSQLSVAASMQATADSGLCLDRCPERVGVNLGTALGGIAFGEQEHEKFVENGPRAASVMTALAVFSGAGASNIAMDLGLHGPAMGNANSCTSGTIAIGEAFRLLRDDPHASLDVVLAGGAEAPLAPLSFGAFSMIKAMSTANDVPEHASRPFDRLRDGFVMAEGSAVLMLEDREHARARGARIYAEVLGYAHTNDAYHMTAPRPDAAQSTRAIQLAMTDAGIQPQHVDYVNAHASATPLNDSTEVRAIRHALGRRAEEVPVTGTKGLHGHALGASGAIEAAIACLAIDRGWVPGTANLREADPECDLQHFPQGGLDMQPGIVLSNSFGFGGINACLVLAHPDWLD